MYLTREECQRVLEGKERCVSCVLETVYFPVNSDNSIIDIDTIIDGPGL